MSKTTDYLISLRNDSVTPEFEFKTRRDLYQKQRTAWEFQYKCIRAKTLHHDGYNVDFPIKTEECYTEFLADASWQAKLAKVEVYATDHWYFQKEYC